MTVGLLGLPFAAGHRVAAHSPVPAAAACGGATYTVASGDSWGLIAGRSGVTLTALLVANGATIATVIHPGQVLCLRAGAGTTTARPSSAQLPTGAVPIAQFPVQGPCWFGDSFGAPRGGGRTHEGVDIIAARGQRTYAVDAGVLSKQFIDAPGSLSGNGWRLRRDDGTYFVYAHLSAFAPGLGVGSRVAAGQILGLVGMTGNAGTAHLHFEVHPGGGVAIDPTPTVAAVNGCRTTAIPAQPGAIPVITVPSATSGVATTGRPAATTNPKPTVPKTVKPATTTATTTTEATTTTTEATTTTTTPPHATDDLWQFVAPITVLDTTTSPLTAGATRVVSVVGPRGLLADVPAVMVRVVARNPAAAGDLAVHRCDGGPASATTLHYSPGRANATVTSVVVGPHGFCVTASTAVDLRLDVIAYQADVGVGSVAVDARRALDTRLAAPLVPDVPLDVTPDQLAAPEGTHAVTMTVTLLAPASAGTISLGPCDGTAWTIPFAATPVQMVSAVVPIGEAGLCVAATTSVHVVVDVTGVWTGRLPLVSTGPTRLFDSRPTGPITDTSRRVQLVLPSGATRAQLSIVVVGAASGGALYA
ncbi:MAG: peptidoglycan DD-metalloendopeptidase family protein, partial [Actinomycetota bacterium]